LVLRNQPVAKNDLHQSVVCLASTPRQPGAVPSDARISYVTSLLVPAALCIERIDDVGNRSYLLRPTIIPELDESRESEREPT